MKYYDLNGSRLSAMTLGTVQLGMDYGIGGKIEKPDKDYAFAILDRAIESGVNILDTANNYGDSERVIGE
nr:aldo/keto reductase [Clostridia bacterium]